MNFFLILIALCSLLYGRILELKWLYVSSGAYLDRWKGATPVQWEGRGEEPYPPTGAPPQNFYSLNAGLLWQWPFHVQTGIHFNTFYNYIGAYEAYQNGEIITLSEGVYGFGDIRFQYRYNTKRFPIGVELNFIVPGIYQRSLTRISPQGATVEPWTGLGAFHLGLAGDINLPRVFAQVYYTLALPSTSRAQIESGDFDAGGRILFKHPFSNTVTGKAGVAGEFKYYHWKQLEGRLRQDFTLSPILSLSRIFLSTREISLSFGINAYSRIKDPYIEDPSGSMFFGFYSGWYF